MIDVLLNAFRLVAIGNQRTRGSDTIAFFNSGGLGILVAVRLDLIDDYSPLAFDIDGAEWLDVSGGTRA